MLSCGLSMAVILSLHCPASALAEVIVNATPESQLLSICSGQQHQKSPGPSFQFEAADADQSSSSCPEFEGLRCALVLHMCGLSPMLQSVSAALCVLGSRIL